MINKLLITIILNILKNINNKKGSNLIMNKLIKNNLIKANLIKKN